MSKEGYTFEPPTGSGADLVMLLYNRYKEHMGLEWYCYNKTERITAETLGDMDYLPQRLGNDLENGVKVFVERHGEDYSEIDPDRNPVSVVYRFVFPDGKMRWLFVSGYYVSHDGQYWDGYREVVRKEKLVTYYE